jgi:hypothetical protein
MDATDENMRFYVCVEAKRGKTGDEILQQLHEVFGDNKPSRAFVYKWLKISREEQRESVDTLPRSGRPISQRTDSNISRVFDFIEMEPKSSLSVIADSLILSKESVRRILTEDLLFKKVCSVWIPHHLTQQNKDNRVACAQNIQRMMRNYSIPTLMRIFATEDETWVPFQMEAPKADNMAWIAPGAARPRVVRNQLTPWKTMLSVAFTGNKKVSMQVTERGETVDASRYIDFVKTTGDLWRTLRTDPTHLSDLIWMHDNARPHTAKITQEFFDRRKVERLHQAPYSPDLNLCDRWLFKEVKKGLRKVQISSASDVKHHSLQVFRQIPEERFEKELLSLKSHCAAVVASGGDYVTK